MINLSTNAQMRLMDNQKVLFKSDFILNTDNGRNSNVGTGEPLDGKNLNYGIEKTYKFYNSLSTGFALPTNGKYDFGCNFKDIPFELFKKKKYIVISIELNINTPDTVSYIRPFFQDIHYDNSVWSYIGNSIDTPISNDVWTRVYQVCECSHYLNDPSVAYIDCMGIRYLDADKNIIKVSSVNYSYRNIMFELNDTGVPSDFEKSYVYYGGSYFDFTSTMKRLHGDDVMSGSATITDATSSSGRFDIGSAIINSLNITLNNFDDRFSLYDFTGATMKVYLGVPLVDEITDEEDTTQVEWVVKGFYTVDKPTSIGNTIPITMLDNMSKFEVLFKEVNVTYPVTLDKLIKAICLRCGVVQGTSVPNPNWTISNAPDDDSLTCLDIISFIAQINGCYARADRNGYLTFGWYNFDELGNDTGDNYDGGTFLTESIPYSDGDELEGGSFDGSSLPYVDEEGVSRVRYANPSEEYDGGVFAWGRYHVVRAFTDYSVATEDIEITGIQFKVEDEASGEKEYLYDTKGNVAEPLDTTGLNLIKSTKIDAVTIPYTASYYGYLMRDDNDFNLQDIPISLLSKYKYAIASLEYKCDAFGNTNEIYVLILGQYKNLTGTWSGVTRNYFTADADGEWHKIYVIAETSQLLSYNGNALQSLSHLSVYGTAIDDSQQQPFTNIQYRNIMFELNNTGEMHDYVSQYVLQEGNSYDDFVTIDEQRKIDSSIYALEIANNKLIPLLNSPDDCMRYIAKKIVGTTFRPYNITTLSNPTYEAGDIIKIVDNKGNDYYSMITSLSYPLNGYETLNCDAETVNEHNSANSNNLSTAIASVKNDTNVKLSAYDKAVRNLTSLSANALGFYETSEIDELDGSRIEYMHDKPLLEDSLIGYKKTLSGFFIGNRTSVTDDWTWVAGVDMEGNAVYKILTAHGINADWINAGTITGREINNGNGTFHVNENGYLSASNANITGTINSGNGKIGGFNIESNNLHTGSSADGVWLSGDSADGCPNGQVTVGVHGYGLIRLGYRHNGRNGIVWEVNHNDKYFIDLYKLGEKI